jgi:hypothetical protein
MVIGTLESLRAFVCDPAKGGVPDDVIILDNGRWVKRENTVHEGPCRCDRSACVGHKNTVYCYFEMGMSPWLVKDRTFLAGYDKSIFCPRCFRKHKRGPIGRVDICGTPYRNEELQSDEL